MIPMSTSLHKDTLYIELENEAHSIPVKLPKKNGFAVMSQSRPKILT